MRYRRIKQVDAAADWKPAADGSHYPTKGAFLLDDDPSVPYAVTVEMDVVGGKPICRRLTAERKPEGIPVTRRGLNAIPLAEIVEEIVRRFSLRFEPVGDGRKRARATTEAERTAGVQAMRPPRGRRRDAESRRALIERVAELYQELVNNKISHPKPVIAEQLGYSTSYIGALVAEARRMTPPLIGKPTGPGRAGNVTTKKRGKRESNG